MSSSGGESHPSALTEPDVRLSPHPALPLQPQRRLCLRHGLLPLLVDQFPRLESRAPSLHPHYRASSLRRARPPLHLASVLGSSWVHHLEVSLGIEAKVPTFRTRACAGLTPSSCRSPLGPSAGIPRAPSQANVRSPVSMTSLTLSTRQQRFTRVRLSSAHLTGSSRLFRNAHHPGHWAGAASGGLDSDPAARVRGACPHLLCSMAALGGHDVGLLSAPSWRTNVRVRTLCYSATAKRRLESTINNVGIMRSPNRAIALPDQLESAEIRQYLNATYDA